MIYVTRNYVNRLAVAANKMSKEDPYLSAMMKLELQEIHRLVDEGKAMLTFNQYPWRFNSRLPKNGVILEHSSTEEVLQFKNMKSASMYLRCSITTLKNRAKANHKLNGYYVNIIDN